MPLLNYISSTIENKVKSKPQYNRWLSHYSVIGAELEIIVKAFDNYFFVSTNSMFYPSTFYDAFHEHLEKPPYFYFLFSNVLGEYYQFNRGWIKIQL